MTIVNVHMCDLCIQRLCNNAAVVLIQSQILNF